MNCESVREEIALLFYDELSPERRIALEDHLEACPGCRGEFDRTKALHVVLEQREVEPPPGLLSRCRRQLAEEVYKRESPATLTAGLRRLWKRLWNISFTPAMVWKPAGALALVALGFFSARLIPTGTGDVVTMPQYTRTAGPASLPVTTNIRSIEPQPDGGFRVQVEEVRQRVLTGGMDDERIRGLMLQAARGSIDPGLRSESVEALTATPGQEDVTETLLAAARHDPNAGVRLKALEGLKPRATDPAIRKALRDVLFTDDNPGVRILAIDLLTQNRDDRLVPVLQQLLRQENNEYVRYKCRTTLRDLNASAEIY
jgi:hypothetical protein